MAKPPAPSEGRKTGTYSPKQAGREKPVGPTPWRDWPEVGPGPREAVDLRDDDPRWVGVEPKSRGGTRRDRDSAGGVRRWVMGDRGDEHLAATLFFRADRQHHHCRTVLGSFLAPLRRLGIPEVGVTNDEAGSRFRYRRHAPPSVRGRIGPPRRAVLREESPLCQRRTGFPPQSPAGPGA